MRDNEESINKNTLVTKRNFREAISYWFDNFHLCFYPLLGLLFFFFAIINGLKANEFPTENIIVLLYVTPMTIWMIHGVLNINKLIRNEGLDPLTNKTLIEEQLRNDYPGFQFHSQAKKFTAYRPWTYRAPAKEITVYFDKRDILINIKSFLRYGKMESPFHVLHNRLEARDILDKFRARNKNATQHIV